MDGERFDHLTRRLAESLPRRRLLGRVGGALAGGLLAGRAARVGGITCQPGTSECPPYFDFAQGNCCPDG